MVPGPDVPSTTVNAHSKISKKDEYENQSSRKEWPLRLGVGTGLYEDVEFLGIATVQTLK
jgi:hypothetical protein